MSSSSNIYYEEASFSINPKLTDQDQKDLQTHIDSLKKELFTTLDPKLCGFFWKYENGMIMVDDTNQYTESNIYYQLKTY